MFQQYSKEKLPCFKLIYFPARARAEAIRLIFAQAGVEYEDVRVDFATFGKDYKAAAPFGQAPILHVDGKPLAESLTIMRYLARLFDLAGKKPFDQAVAESAVDGLDDIQSEIFKLIFEKDEDEKKKKIKELEETKMTQYLTGVNKMIDNNEKSNMHIVGEGLTWADIFLYEVVCKLTVFYGEDFLKKYPHVAAAYKHVADLPNIKAWVAKRPETPF